MRGLLNRGLKALILSKRTMSEVINGPSIPEPKMESTEPKLDPEKPSKVESAFKVEDESSRSERNKKKKCVVMLGYCGQGYLGMQRNPGYKTIEDDLLTAMFRADLISDDDLGTPHRISFQRASRTDKGVSAVRQVVSIKIAHDEDTVSKINKYLPEQIRVFDIRRGTKRFDAKISCNYRTYSYLCPSFALAPSTEETTEDFRITPEIIKDTRQHCLKFKGTHNFHNYTSGKKPNEASANRYIVEFKCSDPFVRDGMEFIYFVVKGQSFMLHQIRKMIGVVIAVVRGATTPDLFDKTWKPVRVDIPKAPGLGLMLEEVHYDAYNKKFSGDGLHEALVWTQYKDMIEEFKEKHILPAMIKGEKEEKSMLSWLNTLDLHSYDSRQEGPNERPLRINAEDGEEEAEGTNKRKECSESENDSKKLKVEEIESVEKKEEAQT